MSRPVTYCTFPGCNEKHRGRGYCSFHYNRWRQHGDPSKTYRLRTPFWSRVEKTDTCWNWTGAVNRGYGRYGRLAAYRYAWEEANGPIPTGLTIDHLCRNKRCVRPDHLEPVTSAENSRRNPIGAAAANREKTHCKRGHPFDQSNTIWNGKRRQCRTCMRFLKRRWREARGLVRTPIYIIRKEAAFAAYEEAAKLKSEGWTRPEIAKRFGVAPKTVTGWFWRFGRRGQRPGDPAVLVVAYPEEGT